MHRADDLIDTTEMYLRCVMELEEDGVIPMRARIAGRLGQSFPTVSQTVARMQRDGLVTVTGDRRIELTPEGRSAAIRVMRKHRLAECLRAGGRIQIGTGQHGIEIGATAAAHIFVTACHETRVAAAGAA